MLDERFIFPQNIPFTHDSICHSPPPPSPLLRRHPRLHRGRPPAVPLHIHRSQDHGLTWKKQDTLIHPNSFGHLPSMHMNDHGITLRHGPYKGRLIRPTRWYGRTNYPQEFFHTHYTNAMFSDDGGRTWMTSEPFFNLSWLLAGEATGNGSVPDWARP